jgi:hypothetical protein
MLSSSTLLLRQSAAEPDLHIFPIIHKFNDQNVDKPITMFEFAMSLVCELLVGWLTISEQIFIIFSVNQIGARRKSEVDGQWLLDPAWTIWKDWYLHSAIQIEFPCHIHESKVIPEKDPKMGDFESSVIYLHRR